MGGSVPKKKKKKKKKRGGGEVEGIKIKGTFGYYGCIPIPNTPTLSLSPPSPFTPQPMLINQRILGLYIYISRQNVFPTLF